MSWCRKLMADGWQYIFPLNDKKEHTLTIPPEGHPIWCECNPRVDSNDKIVIHNAFDMREAQEYANDPKKYEQGLH